MTKFCLSELRVVAIFMLYFSGWSPLELVIPAGHPCMIEARRVQRFASALDPLQDIDAPMEKHWDILEQEEKV